MTLSQKIEEISIDKKQAEQIKVIFECGFAIGIAFHQVTGINPNHEVYDTMKKKYMELIPEQIIETFDAIMREYEKQQKH